MKLIVQIPCFNEAETLPEVLSRLPRTLGGVDAIETLVVDDGSSDGTAETARRLGVTHLVELGRNRGLGIAFRTGLDACLKLGADLIVNTDGDNQYAGSDVGALIEPILQGRADLVVGARDIDAISYFRPPRSGCNGWGAGWFAPWPAVPWKTPPAASAPTIGEAALRTIVHTRFSYTLETVIQAGAGHLRVTSVPIRVNPKLRESRLAGSTWYYLKKSVVTILRIYTMYNPLRVFLFLGGGRLPFGVPAGPALSLFFLSGICRRSRPIADSGGHSDDRGLSGHCGCAGGGPDCSQSKA